MISQRTSLGATWEGAGGLPPRRSRRRAPRARRRWGAVLAVLGVLAGSFAAGAWALRHVRPLHELALETVVTTGHWRLALWFATPAEVEAARAASLGVSTQAATPIAAPPQRPDRVVIEPVRGSTYRGYVALAYDPLAVRVVVTHRLGVQGEKVSQFGAEYHALLAVNGGGFNDPAGESLGGVPTGITIADGQVVSDEPGDMNVIGLTARGQLVAGRYTLAQLRALDVTNAVSFGGPILVEDGRGLITSGDGGWGYGPRTAIGQRADGTLIFVVIDGRRPLWSIGASMRQVQDLMLREGAVTAAALDGGSSSVMWAGGRVLNRPCAITPDGQRWVPDAFVVLPPQRAGRW